MNLKEWPLSLPERTVNIAIVAARFNQFITDQLLAGAKDALSRGAQQADPVTVAWVPGAYELPLAADRLLASGRYDGVVALGAVIRGGTPHFDFVADACSRGLAEVALKRGRPVAFGVLTTDTVEQALERASVDSGNKGFDVTQATLNMIRLLDRVDADE